MVAVICSGGKQYKVSEGQSILVEKLAVEEGSEIQLEVVYAFDNDGKPVDAKVSAKAEGVVKGDKIVVFKYKPKKNIRKKNGHRQKYTKLTITKIG